MICFIPARGSSKTVPRKNLKLLGGKPLLVWSIETALALGLRTIVHTEDREIADVAEQYGAESLFVTPEEAREKHIHQDDSSMYELLKSELPRIDTIEDACILLQPTTPFRNTDEVGVMLGSFEESDVDSLIAVERVPEKWNPAQVMVNGKMADGRPIKDRIIRRQDFPEAFTPTGAVYIFKMSNLKNGSMYGDRVKLIETSPTININTEEDFSEAEQQLHD